MAEVENVDEITEKRLRLLSVIHGVAITEIVKNGVYLLLRDGSRVDKPSQ